MGEYLFKKFLEDVVEDLSKLILEIGVIGLLQEFELWLDTKGFLK